MTDRASGSAVGRSLVGVLASAAAGAAVLIAGRELPLPHRFTGRSIERWWQAVGPLMAVFAVARLWLLAAAALVTLAFAWLTIALAGQSGSALARSVLVGRGLPGLGAVLRLAIALSATGAAVAGCGSGARPVAAGGAAGKPPPAPVLTNTAAPTGPSGTARTPAPPRPRPAVLTPATPAAPAAPPASATGGPAVPAASSRPTAPGGRWLVRPGDSLWSIAEATVGGAPDRVAPYWAELVAANRPTLPDPGDPSLLFPGDVVVLPHLRGAPP